MNTTPGLSPQQIAESAAQEMWRQDRTSQGLGLKLEKIGPGTATLTMDVSEAMSNGHGNCHGGYVFTLADCAFSFASNSRGQKGVGQHCIITYIRPGRIKDRLTAIATEVSRVGRSGIYDVRVVNQDGEHIAEFCGFSRMLAGSTGSD
jgi:acyl-CoA thioesterase